VFSAAATKYKQKHGEIPVLIIDNANEMTRDELAQIQDYAKNATDDGMASVVFVTSEGCVPRIMMERSSWSRRGTILKIPDVSEAEALEYLEKRKVNKEDAKKIYGLVGGRVIDLNFAADQVKKGLEFERMYRLLYAENSVDAHYSYRHKNGFAFCCP
jgi:hypothetical protein